MTKTPKPAAKDARVMTEGQRAYEAKRAAKAGVSLDKWLTQKDRERETEQRGRQREAVRASVPAKPPGFFSRLISKAEKPLK